MTTKKEIRDLSGLFVALHWRRPDSATAYKWAESHLKIGDDLGYGTKPAKDGTKTRESIDYYAKLTKEQKPAFDEFWKAWGKHGDRNRGTMTFIKQWEHMIHEQEWLISSATIEREARKTRDGISPYAEKWLNNYRWRDHPNPQRAKADQAKIERQQKLRELNTNLSAFKQQLKNDQSQVLKDAIKQTEAEIKKLQETNDD